MRMRPRRGIAPLSALHMGSRHRPLYDRGWSGPARRAQPCHVPPGLPGDTRATRTEDRTVTSRRSERCFPTGSRRAGPKSRTPGRPGWSEADLVRLRPPRPTTDPGCSRRAATGAEAPGPAAGPGLRQGPQPLDPALFQGRRSPGRRPSISSELQALPQPTGQRQAIPLQPQATRSHRSSRRGQLPQGSHGRGGRVAIQPL